jgi:hypothetical protein
MYLVVSYWEPKSGKESQFEEAGMRVGSVLRKQPGVLLLEEFKSDQTYVSVHGYRDEKTYRKLIDDPNGEFNKALKQYKIEDLATWVNSERGETIPIK